MLSVTQIEAIDKPSDALCNLCLRPFNFTIIFHDDKKDENKVLEITHPCKFSSMTLPYAKVNKKKLNNIQFNEALS